MTVLNAVTRSFLTWSSKSRTCHLKIELLSNSPANLVRIGLSVRNSVLITSTGILNMSVQNLLRYEKNRALRALIFSGLRPSTTWDHSLYKDNLWTIFTQDQVKTLALPKVFVCCQMPSAQVFL